MDPVPPGAVALYVAGIVVIALVFVLLSGIRVAAEYQRGVVFRLGRYVGLRGPGIYWIIPLGIDRAVRIDIRTRTVSAEQQETITRDSVTIRVNAVLPGMVLTERQKRLWIDEAAIAGGIDRQCLKRSLVAADMVGPCLFLASDASAAITAQTLIVDGGML